MSTSGYGRGYFGNEQMDRQPKRAGVGWFKVLAATGLGVAAWYFWPRKGESPSAASEAVPTAALNDDTLMHVARARGFASAKAYEDALIASAKELRATDAKVEFSPHFQYLDKRVEAP